MDLVGEVCWRLSGGEGQYRQYLPALETALARGEPVFVDLHRALENHSAHISVVAPLSNEEEPFGALVLITDAEIDSPGPRIVYVNESLCQMTGYRPEDLIGQTPRIFQGPETDRSVLDELRACLEQGRPFEGSTVNYRRDGSPYLVQWKTVPVAGDAGTPRYFVSVQRDLSLIHI